LKGRFEVAGYRSQARRLFPRRLPTNMNVGHWVKWTRDYVGQHAAIAILESLAGQHFQRVLHDVSKPFRTLVLAGSPAPNLIRQCVEKMDHLKGEIHAFRRSQLSPVLGSEPRRWVNLETVLDEIIEEEEEYSPEVNWQLLTHSRVDLLFCEPGLLRRALSCLLHNATEACSAIRDITRESPQVVLAQDAGVCRIAITNPYLEGHTTDRQRTGYGLPDAHAIIERILRGKLTGPEFNIEDRHCRVEVQLPNARAFTGPTDSEKET